MGAVRSEPCRSTWMAACIHLFVRVNECVCLWLWWSASSLKVTFCLHTCCYSLLSTLMMTSASGSPVQRWMRTWGTLLSKNKSASFCLFVFLMPRGPSFKCCLSCSSILHQHGAVLGIGAAWTPPNAVSLLTLVLFPISGRPGCASIQCLALDFYDMFAQICTKLGRKKQAWSLAQCEGISRDDISCWRNLASHCNTSCDILTKQ